MRSFLLSLVLAVFVLQGCEGPEGADSQNSETAQTSADISASTKVAYDLDAQGRILRKLESCVKNELGAINDVAPTKGEGDWEIRIIAKDSKDFSVYCESLITLSTVILKPGAKAEAEQGGNGLYYLRDHQVTTFPSEKLGSVCETIMGDFEKILEEEGR